MQRRKFSREFKLEVAQSKPDSLLHHSDQGSQ